MEERVNYPIDGVLDLHVFRPREVASVVQEYLKVCRDQGILRIRIIHGKGRSVLRATVHRLLDQEASVHRYQAAPDRSGWGATIVWLLPPDS